jgi:HAD superfamily hydrolase (TIGR01459 family)
MRRLQDLGAIIGEADAFLLDQFGTLHDGAALYPGVAAALRRVRASGARVLILSNSGSRASRNAARLARLGLSPGQYDGFLSSGEVAWRMLSGPRPPSLRGARRCLVLARGDGPDLLNGLDLLRVQDAAEADLILLLGSEADRLGLDPYRERLLPAARRGIPCLCANPDRLMVLPGGAEAAAAGTIAEAYEAMGGPVIWIGKPHGAIYDEAFATLGGVPRARIWAVGDSVEHDVAGGARQSCRSALVLTGIAAALDAIGLEAEIKRFGASPDVVLPAFIWPEAQPCSGSATEGR